MDPRDLLIGGGILGAVTCLGCCVFIAVPNFVEMQNRAKRAEAPSLLAGIRTAEMAYDAAFDEYVACPPHPRPVEELDDELVPWPHNPCFDQLGWMPDGDVRGTYWIEVNSAAVGGFTAHAMIDADGDGVPAHYIATDTQEPTLVTPPEVM